jgi:MtrB/PioB family decaheme-associated outer membrane protein
MKKTLCLATVFFLLGSAASLALAEEQIIGTGGFTLGVQQVETNRNSAKFNEYRDIRDGFYLYNFWFDLLEDQNFLSFDGRNLLRDDQSINFRMGGYGRWSLEVNRHEIPHRLSNRARTPYLHDGDGLFTVPLPVRLPAADLGDPASGYNLAPSQAQADAGLLTNNDTAIADWLNTHLRATELGTQRNRTSGAIKLSPFGGVNLRLSYLDERKDGSKITYGPIGDRPPRTLNIQFAEPIEYATRELKFEAEYNQPGYQALFTYLYSDFDNEIETLRWQNIYARTGVELADPTYDQWAGHRVATFGQRPLQPDNRYHNASISLGVNLPMASRLTATAAYGLMDQDEKLLPYSTSNFGTGTLGAARELPRSSADAEIDTKLFKADYTISPLAGLNLQAFFRYYDLDNDTPQEQWWYVTSDTVSGAFGAEVINPTFKNQRVNLAYAFDQKNYGLDAGYRVGFWRTGLELGYEREEIDRDFREADTDENIYKASIRTRPANWLTLRARYLFGDREGDNYNNGVTAASYWYDTTIPRDNDNPAVSFSNHPDMRKFDVADRERNQLDIAASVVPITDFDLTASYMYRKDDFDSGVNPTQPLLGNQLAEAGDVNRETPGDQLGLLEKKTRRYAAEASYAPVARLTLTAFGSRETIEAKQWGLEFNENNKLNPSAVDTAELGPWDRSANQWIAETDDRTNTFGVGAGFEIIPGRLRLLSDYTVSRGKVDIDYRGFGQVFATDQHGVAGQFTPDEYQFAFRSPARVKHDQYIVNASLEYQVVTNLVFGFHYIFDRLKTSDWMEEASGFWVEQVGSEFFLRDTSATGAAPPGASTQWGNRLVTMATPLAPSYEAHVGSVTMTYRF